VAVATICFERGVVVVSHFHSDVHQESI
jgi:hypothetical protein